MQCILNNKVEMAIMEQAAADSQYKRMELMFHSLATISNPAIPRFFLV